MFIWHQIMASTKTFALLTRLSPTSLLVWNWYGKIGKGRTTFIPSKLLLGSAPFADWVYAFLLVAWKKLENIITWEAFHHMAIS
jgi:hypothetical protein